MTKSYEEVRLEMIDEVNDLASEYWGSDCYLIQLESYYNRRGIGEYPGIGNLSHHDSAWIIDDLKTRLEGRAL